MTPLSNAISRAGVDDAFVEDEQRVSNWLIEAKILGAKGETDAAADLFARAAEVEEHLSRRCVELGIDQRKEYSHRVSALSCWSHAGNLLRAIDLADDLLARPDVPEPLRVAVAKFVDKAKARRVQWLMESAGETNAPHAPLAAAG